MIKYHKDVLWLQPFVEAAARFVKIEKITHVRCLKTPLNREEQSYATISVDCEKKTKNISLNIKMQMHKFEKVGNNLYSVKGYKALDKWVILDSLAHELAHMKHWVHDAKHFRLQSKIMVMFANMEVRSEKAKSKV
jgi:WLM domain